jgi:hypothetical protein
VNAQVGVNACENKTRGKRPLQKQHHFHSFSPFITWSR